MSARLAKILAAFAVALVLFLLLAPFVDSLLQPSHAVTAEKHMTTSLVVALEAYREDYKDFPRGTQAEIMRALKGENPRKIVYFEARERSFNKEGQLVDRWQTPYRIEQDATPRPRVSSAGKNKIFDGDARGSDDICSWR